MKLPDDFTESMKALMGREYDDFISSYDHAGVHSLRINRSKVDPDRFEKITPFDIERIPFADNGYYINENDGWGIHPYHHAGLYYIQEASAMLPVTYLPVDDGDAVLDLCAAPGGKSTALSAENISILVSNDISHSRAIPLVKNLDHFGRGNYLVTCMEPSAMVPFYRESFDKVLVDAPCSGEGMFRKDPHLVEAYLKKGPEGYCDVQKQILENAYEMTAPGGMIMYSTCTFSDIEDEQVILSILDRHTDLKLIDTDKKSGLCGVYEKYRDNKRLDGCVHAFPHKIRGEGHFMALIRKEGGSERRSLKGEDASIGFEALSDEVRSFFDIYSDEYIYRLRNNRFIISPDGIITMIPANAPGYIHRKVRYMRTGICIGTLNRSGRFTAHTSLALSLLPQDLDNRVNLPVDMASRYLKGETVITDSPCEKGTVLVCVDGFALGFAKNDGRRLKNMYEKGWIIR